MKRSFFKPAKEETAEPAPNDAQEEEEPIPDNNKESGLLKRRRPEGSPLPVHLPKKLEYDRREREPSPHPTGPSETPKQSKKQGASQRGVEYGDD